MNKRIINKGHSTLDLLINWTLAIGSGTIVIIGLLAILNYEADNVDKQYCRGLQAQAEQYKNFSLSTDNPGGFYITQLDKDQCDSLGIKIKAPVR